MGLRRKRGWELGSQRQREEGEGGADWVRGEGMGGRRTLGWGGGSLIDIPGGLLTSSLFYPHRKPGRGMYRVIGFIGLG